LLILRVGWQFWIDRGGTFTDIVARRPDGALIAHKLLSDSERYEDAAIHGIRHLLGVAPGTALPAHDIEAVRMGTTVATNALLERRGDRTVYVTTRGFADALRIAWQHRPKLFVRRIELPSMLYEEAIEVDERMGAHGEIVRAFDVTAAEPPLRAAFDRGIRACAIVLMHGYRYPAHEQELAALARRIGFTQISVSHRVSPLMKLVSRGDTTVADAYLSPVLRRYVERVAAALPGTRLQFMQSSGGLADANAFHGKDAILSGPAGGIVGAARAARAAGFNKIIAFDMGGTSTDVGHFAGESADDFERALDVEVAGVRLRTPILRIHTVAAGGGSICRFDGVRLRVGPESAGANPGPASYRRGGPLTVTDCNVLLGRIRPEFFPSLFGPGGDEPLDEEVVRRQFGELAAALPADSRSDIQALAAGCVRIAVANMANAIKKISVQRGHDVTEYTLTCFGGAAGQHACAVADALGMRRVFVHPLAGVLSAYGIGLADSIAMRQRTVESPLDAGALSAIEPVFVALESEARAELAAQGFPAPTIVRSLLVKYTDTDSTLTLALTGSSTWDSLTREFLAKYRARYGFSVAGRALVIDAISVTATARGDVVDDRPAFTPRAGPLTPVARHPVFFETERVETPFFLREQLRPGDVLAGPAVICERNTGVVVERGWRAMLTDADHLVLEKSAAKATRENSSLRADPVRLEIFNNLFMAIAEQMGVALANTASSVNIKERLDFSCAIFDAAGELIANAPHMPVHLGSMGESVREILRRRARVGAMQPGDAFALNAPYAGGTHLPDVTVVMPVFLEAGSGPQFFVAARGHHADIGGITPGSMPSDSKTIDEEGVLIDNLRIVERGVFLEDALREKLRGGAHPARNVPQNLADLRAQIASCQKGITELEAMTRHYGLDVVHAYMGHVQDNAEAAVRARIGELRDGAFAYEMDNGAVIRVAIRIDRVRRTATIDFTGTSAQQPNNFNAPLPVTRAAVLYVFRTLVDDEIPMNSGCMRPIELIVPEGCLLNPRYPAAVVAGNVETSQVVTDCLYGALGMLAASQGTMNNLTFGNETHQYYETISGGSGAGPDFDGTDAVQTHMTNSRLTDPEVLEFRFPVRLESFRIRRGSGGAGRHRGGDGVERRLRFLEPMTAVMLANRRRVAPFGLDGGESAETGRNWIERLDGRREEFAATFSSAVAPGDVIVVQTPGGGGFGKR
jgi:5-oxoprolinase (ATP-hydrolysing)